MPDAIELMRLAAAELGAARNLADSPDERAIPTGLLAIALQLAVANELAVEPNTDRAAFEAEQVGRRRAEEQRDTARSEVRRLENDVQALTRRSMMLHDAVGRYGLHSIDHGAICDVQREPLGTRPCTCGLADLMEDRTPSDRWLREMLVERDTAIGRALATEERYSELLSAVSAWCLGVGPGHAITGAWEAISAAEAVRTDG